MTIGIRYGVHSDAGIVPDRNEDSAYAGAHLLAVADGIADRPGGDIASATVIESLRGLDTEIPAQSLVGTLELGVRRANDELHHLVEGEPSLHGMGATLTAMLRSGSRIALVHIGDSRAYLLRDGVLFQITHDHTLVQSLVDEGRITLEEAASHPQRSVLLRALDGRGEVEPDLSLRDARLGDRYLLCSHGLSGVVSAQTLHHALTEHTEPGGAAERLIDLAKRGGGPENITCVVADVAELTWQESQAARPVMVGAVADRPPGGGSAGRAPFRLPGYTVLEALGEGGYATVYRARQLNPKRNVAIKVVDLRVRERDLRRFQREVEAAARLSAHPNVVTLHAAGALGDGRPYLVMEMCTGGSLADWLRINGPLPPARVREIGVHIAGALGQAHRLGVLHRDIKPHNLLLTEFGQVALADFGIAALPEPGRELSVTLNTMTPAYASPESFDGAEPTAAADVYSLGATLYALLAGRPPRAPERNLPVTALVKHYSAAHDRPVESIAGVPESLMAVLRIALEKDVTRRFRTAAQFRDTLESVRLDA
ncbi:bifunctional protein-serine/threonine kinase/phosphatase [Actinomadura scrupuli]|uniref:bifunctional protein-serine/threonine kinase/phosphatase n=1 Tax=Actinomadura scrupuli TaxID=559629 RepID=UPI003D98B8DF